MKKKVLILLTLLYFLCCFISVDADTNVKVGETKKIFSNAACIISDCTSSSPSLEVAYNANYCNGTGKSAGEATVEITCSGQEKKVLQVKVIDENAINPIISSDDDDNYSSIDTAKVNCSSLGLLRKDLQGIFKLLKFAAPIIVVVMSTYDFIRAVVGKVDGEMKKAFKKLLKRFVFAMLLFFLPNILDFFLGLIDPSYSTCINS